MKQWRVGTISMGILFIFLGIVLLGNTFWDLDIGEIITYGWPLILILLGVEILLFSLFKKEGRLRFDFFSIFILIIALMFTFVIYSVQETGIFSAIKSAINDESYTFDISKSLDISKDIDEIIIDAPNGSFDISGSDSNTADINGSIRISGENKEEAKGNLDKAFTVKTSGNQAIIRVEQLDFSNFINIGKNNTLEANLTITLPKDKFMKVKLINGDIKIRQMEGSGDIDGINGKIEMDSNKGDYEVKTINGKLNILHTDGKLTAETINGEINVDEVNDDMNLETTNGEIDAATSNLNGDIHIKTLNGKISLDIPENANATINAKSSIGDVGGNVEWQSKDKDKDINLGSDKEATLGDGKYTINLNSTHGKIDVTVK